jgi:5-formyltetrahydrofolate cyclo-ligase
MSSTIVEEKRVLRQAMGKRQAGFSQSQAHLDSGRLCQQLRTQPLWERARRVAAFYPMAGEPDLRPLLEEALVAGKSLALPLFDAVGRRYAFHRVESLSDLRPGHFGIIEPRPECPQERLIRLDFWLVPGVAFDPAGGRLGRGKGYYDRLLAETQGHKCGVAFDWQLVERVPAEPHDVCVNSLLTPTRWFYCGTGRAVL